MKALSWAMAFATVTPACSKTEHLPTRGQENSAAQGPQGASQQPIERKDTPGLALSSSAFGSDENIPRRFTCQGNDVSPPLSWSGAPDETKSFSLILDDPDAPDPAAPKTVWVHWVVYNLPPSTHQLEEGAKQLPEGAVEGKNDWKKTGYRGPCPPVGSHRYVHKLYALDTVLPDLGAATKTELERAMQGHILAKAELIGRYQKQ